MKVLELHGRYFRVPSDVECLDDALNRPAQEVILEEINQEKIMEEARAGAPGAS